MAGADTSAAGEAKTYVLADATDAAPYRRVMRNHAATVTVLTAGSAGNRTGLTATSVCSLSDAPPLILACVNRSASGHDLIKASGAFCMNILKSGQHDIAARFAGRAGLEGEQRFAEGKWITLETGAPVLAGALANVDCELAAEHTYDTHSIFIGRARAVRILDRAEPLLYFDGVFRALQPA